MLKIKNGHYSMSKDYSTLKVFIILYMLIDAVHALITAISMFHRTERKFTG